ncbi:MAG: hypothetical protein WCI11_18985 [Candidatus Methylumidiphilus sp.]
MNRFKLAWIIASMSALVVAGCGEKKIEEPIPDTWAVPNQECPHGADKSVLAGRWSYLEQGSSFLLNLDGQGNGGYSWKDGRFVSVCLDRQILRGHWQQSENDREGGFEIKLNSEMTAGDGRWWYSRIGGQNKPKQAGGDFRIERMSSEGNAGLPQQNAAGGFLEDSGLAR